MCCQQFQNEATDHSHCRVATGLLVGDMFDTVVDRSTLIIRDFLTIDKRFLSTLHMDQKLFISRIQVYIVEATHKTYKILVAKGPTGVLASFSYCVGV